MAAGRVPEVKVKRCVPCDNGNKGPQSQVQEVCGPCVNGGW